MITLLRRSSHIYRLQPNHDRWQDLIEHDLYISVDCVRRTNIDVFGNEVVKTLVETPYTELKVISRSIV